MGYRRWVAMSGKAEPPVDEAFVRATVEQTIRARCQGACKYCRASYGGRDAAPAGWDDVASWIFGYCCNRCRRAAGEPRELDIDAALAVLYPKPS